MILCLIFICGCSTTLKEKGFEQNLSFLNKVHIGKVPPVEICTSTVTSPLMPESEVKQEVAAPVSTPVIKKKAEPSPPPAEKKKLRHKPKPKPSYNTVTKPKAKKAAAPADCQQVKKCMEPTVAAINKRIDSIEKQVAQQKDILQDQNKRIRNQEDINSFHHPGDSAKHIDYQGKQTSPPPGSMPFIDAQVKMHKSKSIEIVGINSYVNKNEVEGMERAIERLNVIKSYLKKAGITIPVDKCRVIPPNDVTQNSGTSLIVREMTTQVGGN